MVFLGIQIRALVLAAYALVTLVPVLTLTEAGPQMAAGHVQMMVMAGHTVAMTGMDEAQTDDAQMLLCRQHCLVAAATLPVANRSVERVAQAADLHIGHAPLAPLLAIPPPGPPPKVAVI